MDLALEEIDRLLTDYMYGDDSALDGLLAAGPVSLRRLLAIRAGRAEPGWDMEEIMRRDRDDYRRPGEAQIHLARAFPDAFFDAAEDLVHEWAITETRPWRGATARDREHQSVVKGALRKRR
ncbi:hypothetical protein OG357_01415 [Streptomyces sp. NBC_01255]|uniref:hypothetical protein n=1 Tax=Streptomyces sp. NBC_01255 TaxID=2903798 RepID=UPI002E35A0C7|nr:hypothetical protein [Streptomyces sp. NBC_01255]